MSVLRHFGLGSEMSWDTSDLGLKCLGSKVSGYHENHMISRDKQH